jgi:Ni/Co efflux regulator RcnB
MSTTLIYALSTNAAAHREREREREREKESQREKEKEKERELERERKRKREREREREKEERKCFSSYHLSVSIKFLTAREKDSRVPSDESGSIDKVPDSEREGF